MARAELIQLRNWLGKKMYPKLKETEWTDLQFNSFWQNLDANSYNKLQYKKINNQVFVRGMVKNSINDNNKLSTLPIGFKPLHHIYYSVIINDLPKQCLIQSNGAIFINGYVQNTWVDLGLISFFVN